MSFSFSENIPRAAVVLSLACACSSSSTKETARDAGPTKDATADAHARGDAHRDARDDTGLDAPMDVSLPDVNPCVPDGLDSPDVRVYPADAGSTWPALYRDFFGPAGLASCAGADGGCHAAGGNGYTSSGFLCPPDASTACWKGLTAKGDGSPNIINPPFNEGGLGTILCQNYCVGIMPEGCGYYFTATDMERIQAWVEAGALDGVRDAAPDHP